MNFAENLNENFYKVNNLMLINAHLNGFHWAKSDIGEKFSRGWGDEVERCSVKIRIFLSHRLRVNVLENFVKAEFASSLHGVANQGWGPAASERLDTTVSDGNLKWSIFLFNNLQVFFCFTFIPLPREGYLAASTCMRHLTRSSGTTAVWVNPQERAPPIMHLA